MYKGKVRAILDRITFKLKFENIPDEIYQFLRCKDNCYHYLQHINDVLSDVSSTAYIEEVRKIS